MNSRFLRNRTRLPYLKGKLPGTETGCHEKPPVHDRGLYLVKYL